MISMVDHVASSMETPRIDVECFFYKELKELNHMNPYMVSYLITHEFMILNCAYYMKIWLQRNIFLCYHD